MIIHFEDTDMKAMKLVNADLSTVDNFVQVWMHAFPSAVLVLIECARKAGLLVRALRDGGVECKLPPRRGL